MAAAVSQDKYVVPVLVGGARMPQADSLPLDLRDLAMRHALVLRDANWEEDLSELWRVLDPMMGETVSAPRSDFPRRTGRTRP